MGDRANVYVKQAGVYLYGHSSGYDLAATVKRAIARKQRWDDESYLARIIFCEMVGPYVTSETGFGISATIGDNERPVIIVDTERQTVACSGEGYTQSHTVDVSKVRDEIPFAAFARMTDDAVRKWHIGDTEGE